MAHNLYLPGGRSLALDGRFHVMGILNCTPDSFFDDSRVTLGSAVDRASAMIEAGASILDVGGESTRPGSAYVSTDEELERVVPVLEAIRARWPVALSVDTRKAAVAKAALAVGADIVNDVAALADDPAMPALCAAAGVPVVLMHKKGIPASMQDAPWYADCVGEVLAFLEDRISAAKLAGISADSIILDPGIGFGKRFEDNMALLNQLDRLVAMGLPVLVGLSRKAFLGQLTGKAIGDRLAASLAALLWARQKGAVIFRVHDVAESVDVLKVYDGLMKGGIA